MSYKDKIVRMLDGANEKQLERLWYFIRAFLS